MLNPQQFPMNREERRKHYREAKKDPIAIYCPRCTHKTRHVATPVTPLSRQSAEDREKKTCKCNVVCVACGNILRADVELIPYEYVKRVDTV